PCALPIYGPADQKRQFGDDDLMIERVALATEAAAVRAGDDADAGRRHVQYFGEGPVDVMRRLGARPDGQLAVGIDRRNRGVLLHREVRAPLVIEGVLEHLVRVVETALDVPELERDLLVDVPLVAVLVD